jgi:hypothetical protein
MSVVEVNSGRNAGKLDYRAHHATGLNVIAVGGNSLSRGFTLEGLTVSYFLRNTQMYDTLLQMGRWFGYRDGFQSLCRLYIRSQAHAWYAFIASATEELRDEIARMEAAGLTPEDFGLAVRAHPGGLMVTAKNKMRTATHMVRQVGLAGQLIESTLIYAEPRTREFNVASAESLIETLQRVAQRAYRTSAKSELSSMMFEGVSMEEVLKFVSSYKSPAANVQLQTTALMEYIRTRSFPLWDVVVASNTAATQDQIVPIGGLNIGVQLRGMLRKNNLLYVGGNSRRVASKGLERFGLTSEQIKEAERTHKQDRDAGKAGKSIADHHYRRHREQPLLMIHLLVEKGAATAKQDSAQEVHIAYGVSFPGLRDGEEEQRVAYAVNLVEFRQFYGDLDAEGDEDDEVNDD